MCPPYKSRHSAAHGAIAADFAGFGYHQTAGSLYGPWERPMRRFTVHHGDARTFWGTQADDGSVSMRDARGQLLEYPSIEDAECEFLECGDKWALTWEENGKVVTGGLVTE